ncbi:MAG: hypothetical protein AB1716_11170 [Planctomycetota bacterium]
MSRHLNLPLLFALLLAATAPCLAADLHVCVNEPNCTGYSTIAAAIAAAGNGDTILIHNGTWSGAGNRDLTTGGLVITIRALSDEPNDCVIDCGGPVVPPERGHRAFDLGPADSGVVLQGITIQRGYEWYDPNEPEHGAAIRCVGASPKIIHCIFGNRPNETGRGNVAEGDLSGGAIACFNGASPVLTHCTFSGNSGYFGGAIYYEYDNTHNVGSNVLISHCKFVDNVATGAAGYGRSLYVDRGLSLIVHSTFAEDLAQAGLSREIQIDGGSATLMNCQLFGGHIALYCGTAAVVRLSNCTLADNHANDTSDRSGGITIFDGSDVTIQNSILWNNTNASHQPDPNVPVYIHTGTVRLRYCDLQGEVQNENGTVILDPPGSVIHELPLFRVRDPNDPWSGSYYLAPDPNEPNDPNSPCVDAGLGTAEQGGLGRYTTRIDLAADSGAMDLGYHAPGDCQPPGVGGHGVPDPLEIAIGQSEDCNLNSIPDGCENDPNDPNYPPCACHGLITSVTWSNWCQEYDPNAPGVIRGLLINLECDPGQNGRLRVVPDGRPLPYFYAPASYGSDINAGYVARVSTLSTPTLLGLYRTVPSPGGVATGDPSRTAIDLDGNVWVSNRNQPGVTQLGLYMGGEPCDWTGRPDADGDYVKPVYGAAPIPWYNTCVDRDRDGLLRTSRPKAGQAVPELLPWPAPQNTYSVQYAEDECVLKYEPNVPLNTRHTSVDRNNNVWIGGTGNGSQYWYPAYVALGGVSGALIEVYDPLEYHWGAYGGFMTCDGVIWSTGRTPVAHLLRWDTQYTYEPNDDLAMRVDEVNTTQAYAVASDPNGNVWLTRVDQHKVSWFDPNGIWVGDVGGVAFHFPASIAVHWAREEVWIGSRSDVELERYVTQMQLPPGQNAWNIPLIDPGDDSQSRHRPAGIDFDQDGYPWVTTHETGKVMRIDPNAHAVDYVLDIRRDPNSSCDVYSFSDMTGSVTLQTTRTGTWNTVYDSVRYKAPWRIAHWNKEPNGNPICGGDDPRIHVALRAADELLDLTGAPFKPVANGQHFQGVRGRYLEVRVRLQLDCDDPQGATGPWLCRFRVESNVGDMNCDGLLDFNDINPFVLALSDPAGYAQQYPGCDIMNGDIDDNGFVDFNDINPFVALLSSGGGCP